VHNFNINKHDCAEGVGMTENNLYFRTRIRAKGQITIPGQVREILGAEEGDELAFHVSEVGQVVVEKLMVIQPDQAWFWTERWQTMEHDAQAEIAAGRITHFSNIDEALNALERNENAGD
jgi:AbrB family looped-hinge helix DNA binding protein